MPLPNHPLLVLLLVVVFVVSSILGGTMKVGLLCVIPVWIAGMWFLLHRRLKSTRPTARAAHECSYCGYDLTGLPLDNPDCPECGNRRRYR